MAKHSVDNFSSVHLVSAWMRRDGEQPDRRNVGKRPGRRGFWQLPRRQPDGFFFSAAGCPPGFGAPSSQSAFDLHSLTHDEVCLGK